MLAAISDLHLTDGTTASDPHATAFRLVYEEIVGSISAKGVQDLDLLFLGDIFDLVRTDFWNAHQIQLNERPWGGEDIDPATGLNRGADVESQFVEILKAILAQQSSRALIEMSRLLHTRLNQRVRVIYVIGNHDRIINNFVSLQNLVAEAFAPVPVVFTTSHVDSRYALFARHGHEWDADCHGWQFLNKVLNKNANATRFDPQTYNVMAIGEVVTAELMSGLVYFASQKLKGPEHATFRQALRDVNNLRPMTHVTYWLTWLLEGQTAESLKVAGESFTTALELTLNNPFAKRWDKVKPDLIVSGDVTDYLSKVLGLIHHAGIDVLQKVIPIVETVQSKFGGSGEDEYFKGAYQEFLRPDLPRDIQYVLYGHTHSAMQACYSATRDDHVRMYMNTGTFLPLIEQTHDRRSFMQSNRMTFLCFYDKNEDTTARLNAGPTVDVWDGMKRKLYDQTAQPSPQSLGPLALITH